MSSTPLNIWNGIRTVVGNTLGSSYEEMEHVIDIWDEPFLSSDAKWGIVVDGAPGNETTSVTKGQDFDYRFIVMLGYGWVTAGSTSDRAIIEKTLEYQGLLEDVFVELVKVLRAQPGCETVLNVFEPTLEPPLGLVDRNLKKGKRLFVLVLI